MRAVKENDLLLKLEEVYKLLVTFVATVLSG